MGRLQDACAVMINHRSRSGFRSELQAFIRGKIVTEKT